MPRSAGKHCPAEKKARGSRARKTGRGDHKHENLILTPSIHDKSTVYTKAWEKRRKTSSATSIRSELGKDVPLETFPAALVLPDDDLAEYPRYPPQSLLSWLREPERNEFTSRRRTIYVATAQAGEFMVDWAEPSTTTSKPKGGPGEVARPNTKVVMAYLQAFYHGVPVKQLQVPLQFTTWTDCNPKSGPRRRGQLIHTISAIGINTSTECIRIRTRKSHDGVFAHQLNLDDLLDVCISILPDDAFALLLIVDQDMYQHEDDEFCCGIAAGGSRVAVVSTARYNPLVDQQQEIDREHPWPASHCAAYVEKLCRKADGASRKRKHADTTATPTTINLTSTSAPAKPSPLHAAITAHNSLPPLTSVASPQALHILWLSRVCRTSSHELGHCIGIDHCVFYACIMQGSASIKEDARQPPYLCPVDLAKMLRATGADERERYRALLTFCEAWEEKEGGHMFAGFAGWLRGRMEEA